MAQTPQTFHKDKLLKAYNDNINVNVTDESTLMELSGFSIKIINGDDKNFKITKKIDWELAKIIASENELMIKTGIGYDVHQLKEGLPLIIGGVMIESSLGSVGHSDGDGLIHAICDSLLGASGLGDIGTFFPSDNKKWEKCSEPFVSI